MPDEKPLADLTVAELDDLAVAHEVADYPASANKADKVAALAAGGVGPQPEPVYRLRLKEEMTSASFMASGKAIELSQEDPLFETSDRQVYAGVRDLDFLEEVDG